MNILYIVIDTLRADHLSCYGYFRKTSPSIDRLAEDSILFLNCYSEFPYTLPSFTSLITGICGVGTGIVTNAWRKLNERYIVLDDRIPTLAELLFHRGYTTVAVDNMVNFGYHPKWFVRGYQYYINPRPRPPFSTDERLYDDIVKNTDMVPAEEVNYHALKWLKTHGDKNFFMFIHYWDPHTPYINLPENYSKMFLDEFYANPPRIKFLGDVEYIPGWGKVSDLTPERREFVRLYDCEIRYVDAQVGILLERLKNMGVYDETMIILTSDHGEVMFENHQGFSKERIEFGHGMLYNEVLRVPLILKLPNQELKGKKFHGLVQSFDIFPTILEVAGVKTDFPVDGISLLTMVNSGRGRSSVIGTYVSRSFTARSIITEGWKYIVYSQSDTELYRLTEDPYELNNLAMEERELCFKMHRLLQRVVDKYMRKWGKPDPLKVPELLNWQVGEEAVWKVKPRGEKDFQST